LDTDKVFFWLLYIVEGGYQRLGRTW